MKELSLLILSTFLFSFYSIACPGQEVDSLTIVPNTAITYVEETFFSTRILNGHSVETLKKQQLDFRISHRFGQLNEGIDQFYGLDHGVIHLGLEYGIKDWLQVGIGRSTFEKTVDGFVKASIIRQSSGERNFPVHITYLMSTEIITINTLDTAKIAFHSRLNFIYQLLVARKINENLSVQVSPTLVHRNLIQSSLDRNDLFAIGFAARYKIGRWKAVTVEYYYVNRPNRKLLPTHYYNPLSIGFDFDTGSGHVFQIMLTNSQAMREGGFIGKTTGSWKEGGIHLGFNISRLFSFAKD